ncbi:MAG TPA: Zn-ribbon domain-containing OB-fold protein [Nitrososphaerales archaeon]|nr:Zn-ribbon domain-containing OB-fold protein [Nitrososphaerales archaeon]
MSLGERITSVDKLRSWTDQIPLHYEYTAGVAGEKFLRGLQDGRIIASKCKKCGKSYLPPKAYCVDCFAPIETFRQVGPEGNVAAITESYVGFDGRRLKNPRAFVFVTFKGVTGGLVQIAGGRGVEVGGTVVPKFKPASKRTGSLLDFEFVRLSGRRA